MRHTIKIQPDKLPTLCSTCKEAQITQYTDGTTVVLCHARTSWSPRPVTRAVARCNDYEDANLVDRWEMEKIAWTVSTDKSGKRLGFQPPDKKE